jgi:hypothetical protein
VFIANGEVVPPPVITGTINSPACGACPPGKEPGIGREYIGAMFAGNNAIGWSPSAWGHCTKAVTSGNCWSKTEIITINTTYIAETGIACKCAV